MVNLDTLSPRQRQVVDRAALGYTDEEIAAFLTISVSTVRAHLEKALDRLELGSKRELTRALYGVDEVPR